MQIQNPEAAQLIRDAAKLTIAEGFPQNLLPDVRAVIDMTPRFQKVISFSKESTMSNATGATVHTTDSNRDTYITNAWISFEKDATATTQYFFISGTNPDGAQVILCMMACLATTASRDSLPIAFPFPVKLKKGTTITINASTNTGNFRVTGAVSGYVE